MNATKKEEQAMMECYRRLFKESTPSADFDKLVEEAEYNECGQKVIDFNSYEISEENFFEILENVISEFKIKPKFRAKAFENSILLGCSPRFSKNKNEENE